MTTKKTVYYALKRAFDLCASVLMLMVFLPFWIMIELAILIDDPKGSPIFVQTRVGKDGKEFQLYKFRSMVHNAEEIWHQLQDMNEMDGPAFKIENDPRITRVGKFLRKTSLDEVPQLINVIKGDMSLVGPRPPLPREVEKYTDAQKVRLSVTPGITCFWQVQKRRNSLSFDEWVELDKKYIREQGIRTDIKILFLTIGAVINKEGM